MDVENRRSILLLENDSMDVMQFGIRIDDSIIVPPIFDLIALEIFKSDFSIFLESNIQSMLIFPLSNHFHSRNTEKYEQISDCDNSFCRNAFFKSGSPER